MTSPQNLTATPLQVMPSYTVEGIHIYNRNDYNSWFENEYSTTAEPWAYSHRGAELHRHIYTLEQLKKINARPKALLELGSSKGLMTTQLTRFCERVTASDVSVTAMKACKAYCEATGDKACEMEYFVTTTPGLPFANESFDVVTICDGMEGWWFSDETKRIALEDLYRVLKKGGVAVLSDFFNSEGNIEKFRNYEQIIRESSFSVASVSHLYDKPWYLMESALKKLHLQKALRKLMASVTVAKALNQAGKMLGKKFSNHMVIIARKD